MVLSIYCYWLRSAFDKHKTQNNEKYFSSNRRYEKNQIPSSNREVCLLIQMLVTNSTSAIAIDT
jgi:hypothetical protein